MKYVRKVCSPYNVNGVALECLPVALADEAYLAWYAEQVRMGRERMMAGLRGVRRAVLSQPREFCADEDRVEA